MICSKKVVCEKIEFEIVLSCKINMFNLSFFRQSILSIDILMTTHEFFDASKINNANHIFKNFRFKKFILEALVHQIFWIFPHIFILSKKMPNFKIVLYKKNTSFFFFNPVFPYTSKELRKKNLYIWMAGMPTKTKYTIHSTWKNKILHVLEEMWFRYDEK